MKKKKKIIIVSAIALTLIIWIISSMTGGIPVHAAKASSGVIYQYIDNRAKTRLPKIYNISMPLDGRIMPIDLKPGDTVKENQLLAQLDKDNLQSRLREVKAEMEAVQGQIKINAFNKLEKTAMQESKQWINILKQAVIASGKKAEASRAKNKFAQENYEAQKKSGQAVSRIRLSRAGMEAKDAQMNYESDRVFQKGVEILHNIFQLMPTYLKEYLYRKTLTGSVLKKRLAKIQAEYEIARRNLKRAELKCPTNGTVLKRYVSNERVLPAGTKLLDIGNLEKLQIRTNILSQKATKIQVGNDVDIYGTALGSMTLKGTVSKVYPQGFTKISSLGVEQQRVKVIIDFKQDELKKLKKNSISLGCDFRLQVKIYTAKKTNALIVPRTALFKNENSNWQLFKIENGKTVSTEVSIGLINDNQVQITKGLQLNDKVVIAPPMSLKNNTRVNIISD